MSMWYVLDNKRLKNLLKTVIVVLINVSTGNYAANDICCIIPSRQVFISISCILYFIDTTERYKIVSVSAPNCNFSTKPNWGLGSYGSDHGQKENSRFPRLHWTTQLQLNVKSTKLTNAMKVDSRIYLWNWQSTIYVIPTSIICLMIFCVLWCISIDYGLIL